MRVNLTLKNILIYLLVIILYLTTKSTANELSLNSTSSMSSHSRIMKLANVLTKFGRNKDVMSSRALFNFITDPSLAVTILYTLEIAYWTLPLGFLLMPIINFFRVPNRRIGRLRRMDNNFFDDRSKEKFESIVLEVYSLLLQSVDNFKKIDKNEIKSNHLNNL